VSCSKAYSDSKAALRAWRPVAKHLGFNSQDIAALFGGGSDNPPLPEELNQEQVHQMLTRWREMKHEAVNKDELIKVLRKVKLQEAAENVGQIR